MSVVLSHEIHCREDFALLLNWRVKYVGAVEIGVDRAEFAQGFLSRWYGEDYFGVDDYAPYPEMPWNREADFHMAVTRLERHARRAKLLRCTSEQAAKALEGYGRREFDFVYVDGAHDYDSVIRDIATWWPRVREGGIFAGHDYDDEHKGVRDAVDHFASEGGLTVYLTHERALASWYCYKGGIPGPDWKRLPERHEP